MEHLIRNFSESRKLVSLYFDDSNRQKFACGRIIYANERQFAVELISPNGTFDGILVRNIDCITRVEFDGQYHEKITKMMRTRYSECFHYDIKGASLFVCLLKIAAQTKEVISVEILDSGIYDITGVVDHVKDGICTIRLIDEYGYEDGCSVCQVGDITQIVYASEDENRIRSLWEINIANE